MLSLGFLIFSIFQKLGEQSKVYQQPFNYFPPNPAVFFEIEDGWLEAWERKILIFLQENEGS